jgi:putative RNA 2'-phosphotransferase
MQSIGIYVHIKVTIDEKGNTKMNATTKISKFISLVLRHKPETIGVKLDESGWLDITELIAMSRKSGVNLSSDLIRQIVTLSDKQRFSISDDGLRIRANQGHSIGVDLGLLKTVPPDLLYHGTAKQNLLLIRTQGLLKGKRQYVHLSPDFNCALRVGKRHGKAVVLVIDTARMHRMGFDFFLSINGVWLTDYVPAEYLKLASTF